MTSFYEEAAFLQALTHPFIVQFLGIFEDTDKSAYIVTEYMTKGNLLDLVQREDITAGEMMLIAKQTAGGMLYLSTENIVHRDLALRNILVSSSGAQNFIAKVSDFGMSKFIPDSYYYNKNATIAFKWAAPESYNHGKFSTKSDVWSFGVTLWELFSRGTTPYRGMSNKEAVEQVENGYRLPQPAGCSPEIYALMSRCWEYNPSRRLTFAEIFDFFEKQSTSVEHNHFVNTDDLQINYN